MNPFIERILSFTENLARLKSPKIRFTVTLIALSIFIYGLLVFSENQSIGEISIAYSFPILFFLLPATAIINSIRYKLSAQAINREKKFKDCFEITTYGTLSNLLPIPGGIIVRTTNLKTQPGESYKSALFITLFSSILSAAFTVTIATTAFSLHQGSPLFSIFPLTLLVAIIIFGLNTYNSKAIQKLTLLEVTSTLIDATRIFFCFMIISQAISITESVILSGASVLGSTISIIPAGLGIKEFAGAYMATFISISSSSAFIALAINRGLGILFFITLGFLLNSNKH